MKASIHISTDMVKVLAYTRAGSRTSIKDYLTYPLPDEAVLNGVILDGAPIVEGLSQLKKAKPLLFKEASLVIDGSFVYTKKITVPGKLKKLTYDEVIRDEFAEISTDKDNLICDYHHLSTNEDGSKEILACAVEYAHAQAYLGIFNEAGIKLSSVHLGVLAVLDYVESSTELNNTPLVLNLVDDVILLSMIFQKGVNVFQSRTRLYGEDRVTLVRSTLDGLSGIIQFNKSQNFDDLTNCYYLGFNDSDMDLVELNNNYPEIKFSLLNIYRNVKGAELLPPGAHFAYLYTLVPDNKSDLLSNIRMLEKAKVRRKPKNRWLPLLAGTVLVLAAIITVLFILVSGIERDIRNTNEYLIANSAETNEIERYKADTSRINNLYSAVATRKDETAAKPQISRSLLQTIMRTGGSTVDVNGLSFNSEKRVLGVGASGRTEHDAAMYVEALLRHDQVASVLHTGYSEGTAGEFNFTIDVKDKDWNEEDTTDAES